jgi:hypothetical protein
VIAGIEDVSPSRQFTSYPNPFSSMLVLESTIPGFGDLKFIFLTRWEKK